MSGGSWDYFYLQLDQVANQLRESRDPIRAQFGEKLLQASEAMHDVEWVDSADMLKGDEYPAILKFLEVSPIDLKRTARKLREAAEKLEAIQ